MAGASIRTTIGQQHTRCVSVSRAQNLSLSSVNARCGCACHPPFSQLRLTTIGAARQQSAPRDEAELQQRAASSVLKAFSLTMPLLPTSAGRLNRCVELRALRGWELICSPRMSSHLPNVMPGPASATCRTGITRSITRSITQSITESYEASTCPYPHAATTSTPRLPQHTGDSVTAGRQLQHSMAELQHVTHA